MWPLLSTCFTKFEKDNKVAESCCRTLRFALRCTERYSRNILEDIVNLVSIKIRNWITSSTANNYFFRSLVYITQHISLVICIWEVYLLIYMVPKQHLGMD